MNTHRFCTGESGLPRPLTEAEYKTECDPVKLVSDFCIYWEVPMPEMVWTGKEADDGRFRGLYRRRTHTLRYSHHWVGLVLHEFAHYVVDVKHLNSDRSHHNPAFWKVLQETIDVWR